nr:MAG TPA: hypothetical protein [Caudoviricetes sp.]
MHRLDAEHTPRRSGTAPASRCDKSKAARRSGKTDRPKEKLN